MSTFNGRTIVTMPSTPAPKSIESTKRSIVATSMNPFTGQQQIQDWQAGYTMLSVSMPTMDLATGTSWINFLLSCQGQSYVFAIANTTFASLVPASSTGYWSMNTNDLKWSVNEGQVVGMQFEIREVLA